MTKRTGPRRATLLTLAFGGLAFLESIAEPTEGLSAQPVRALLRSGSADAGAVATFSALLSLPWVVKPLFGLLCDFVPLFGSRRRGYLIVAGIALAAVFITVGNRADAATGRSLLITLVVATAASALADVATDALVVEWGQTLKKTGRFQAVVWFATYASGIVIGWGGGRISQSGETRLAFYCCAVAAVGMLLLAWASREPPRVGRPPSWLEVRQTLAGAVRSRAILTVALFTLLGNFNPLTNPIVQIEMTGPLGLSEQFFGNSQSLFAVFAMVGALTYGLFTDRMPMRALAGGSVVLGLVANFAYLPMKGELSALAATAIVGWAYMTMTLVQFDLAARACPPGAAGTVFATLMAVSNLSASAATWLGGLAYDRVSPGAGAATAFRVLIVAGTVPVALSALVIPWFPESLVRNEKGASG